MMTLGLTRRRLVALYRKVATADGAPDLAAIGSLKAASRHRDELRAILEASAFDFAALQARIDADPDFDNLSRRTRAQALVDYLRAAIGIIDRERAARHPDQGRIGGAA
ncbi:MAG: hypothetical protein AB7P52_12405 [Alphaproteobacteria bacterium]